MGCGTSQPRGAAVANPLRRSQETPYQRSSSCTALTAAAYSIVGLLGEVNTLDGGGSSALLLLLGRLFWC